MCSRLKKVVKAPVMMCGSFVLAVLIVYKSYQLSKETR